MRFYGQADKIIRFAMRRYIESLFHSVSEGVVTPPDTSKSLPIAYCFLQPTPGTYLMRLKKAVTKKKLYKITLTEYQR